MSAPCTLSLLLAALCLLHTGLAQECECPDDGYEVFPSMPGSRYKLAQFPLNWSNARDQCQSDGGGSHLVVINSDLEVEVVKTFLARLSGTSDPYAWVGITDTRSEGDWHTVLGGLVSESGYNRWGVGEPNGDSMANCGYVTTDALYYDGDCPIAVPFICEKPSV